MTYWLLAQMFYTMSHRRLVEAKAAKLGLF